jgi:peptidoglycan DL-endopeptidase CwlO
MSKKEIAIEYAKSFIGKPYIWGGDGSGKKGGFDCSGFVLEVLWSVGAYIGGDTTAQNLLNYARKSWTKSASNEKGGIAFFGKSASAITHVTFCIGNNLMIEAGGGGSDCKTAETSTGFVRMRPITNRKDLVAVYLPTW